MGAFLTFLVALPSTLAISLPKPSGPYGVGITEHIFNHTTPNDPSDPTGTGTFFLASFYYPTLSSPNPSTSVPYFDPVSAELWGPVAQVAPDDLLSLTTDLQWQAPTLNITQAQNIYPTLVFSPGGGVNSYMYYSFLSELASQGYTIIALDHPGEPPYLPLPYGASGIVGWDINMPYNKSLIDDIYRFRVADLLAVLSEDFFPALVAAYGAPFNTSVYGAFGHSIGGSASAAAMAVNPSIVAGINLDGSFVGASADTDIHRPFMMLASEGHSGEGDESWASFPRAQTGWLDSLRVIGMSHLAYSDAPLWLELLPRTAPPNGSEPVNLGDTPGHRADEIVKTYVGAFWEWVRGGKYFSAILDHENEAFPEVLFNQTKRP